MRELRRKTAIVLAVVLTMGQMIHPLAAGNWQSENGKWYHRTEDKLDVGWLSEGEDIWYFLNADGSMSTGWYVDESGNRYYMNQLGEGVEGKMKYGWYQDQSGAWYFFSTEHNGSFGKGLTGWNWIDGYCYFFDASGKMFSSGTTPDGYVVNSDGRWVVDGIVQYQQGKGFASSHNHTMGTTSKKSSGGGSSGGGSSSGGNSSGSGDDNYRVYEESNKMVYEAKDNVKTFPNDTQEDKELLREMADSIVDYWTEKEEVEVIEQQDEAGETAFQSVLKINLVFTSDSVFLDQLAKGNVEENDVIYISPCEAFPTGFSFIYLSHDDDYEGEEIDPYDENTFEVVHATEATFSDMFDEEIFYSAGGVNKKNPVQYIWTPALYGDKIVNYMDYQPAPVEGSSMSTPSDAEDYSYYDDIMDGISLASASNSDIIYDLDWERYSNIDDNLDIATPSQINLLRSSKASENKNHFSIDSTITEKGVNIVANAKNLILYDGDGNTKTKDDQVLLSGKIGMEKLNPEFGFHWNPSMTDLMPKQLKAVVEYEEVIQLEIKMKDGIDTKELIQNMQKAYKQPENKLNFLNIELQGVDWNDTIILAAFGVGVGQKKVCCNIANIQESTKDIKTGLDPMVTIMVLMDIDGNISVTTNLELENRKTVKQGINIQKDGFKGAMGSVAANVGDFNTKVGDYNVNIYNKQDTNTTATLSTEGEAKLDLGVGLGVGLSCLGIMPAMIKGTLGTEAETSGVCEASWDNKTGIAWNTDSEAKIRAYLRLQALIKLKAKVDLWLTDIEVGIDASFLVADITLLEEKLEQHLLTLKYNDAYEKYINYSTAQLKEKFKHRTINRGTQNESTIYYDGELSLYEDYGIEYVDWAPAYEKNTIWIVDETIPDWSSYDSSYYRSIHVKADDIFKGISENTKIGELADIGKVDYFDGYPTDITVSSMVFTPKGHETQVVNEVFDYRDYIEWGNTLKCTANFEQGSIVRDVDAEEVNRLINSIIEKYNDDYWMLWEPGNEMEVTLDSYFRKESINPKAYMTLYRPFPEE